MTSASKKLRISKRIPSRLLSAPKAREWVIADIHGCIRTLQSTLSAINLQSGDRVIFLGDYINKGPDSEGVIDLLYRLKEHKEIEVVYLLGNHDKALLDYYESGDSSLHDQLTQLGSGNFLAKKDRYYPFFKSMVYYAETHSHVFVHAGFDISAIDIAQQSDAMLYTRAWKYDQAWFSGKKVIHGHLPQEIDLLIDQVDQNAAVIKLDTGCVYPDRIGMGVLSAYETTERRLMMTKNCEFYT